jgi:hypothetical protein
MLIHEIEAIQNDKNNLINASSQLKEILYFCYSHYVIDLPEFELEAFGDMVSPQQPPMDILRQEGPKLLDLFVKEFNLNLTRSRRIQIFKDIIRYATNRERIFLFQVVRDRRIPGITKADVVQAFGEQFFSLRAIPPTPVAPVAPVKPAARSRKKEVEMFRPLKSLGYQ